MNRDALRRLRREKRLEIVPGATHLFEEPGTLESVAELSSDWFLQHLRAQVPEHASRWPS
jgi:putative phosphoribosyl transferase